MVGGGGLPRVPGARGGEERAHERRARVARGVDREPRGGPRKGERRQTRPNRALRGQVVPHGERGGVDRKVAGAFQGGRARRARGGQGGEAPARRRAPARARHGVVRALGRALGRRRGGLARQVGQQARGAAGGRREPQLGRALGGEVWRRAHARRAQPSWVPQRRVVELRRAQRRALQQDVGRGILGRRPRAQVWLQLRRRALGRLRGPGGVVGGGAALWLARGGLTQPAAPRGQTSERRRLPQRRLRSSAATAQAFGVS
mmetsp:Transcript_5836/g.19862  ORF Transcript_5836/g.19862 Transcript_5836/m.19862 type:complete len:261 (+) Transcript_5836:871-1653(+)